MSGEDLVAIIERVMPAWESPRAKAALDAVLAALRLDDTGPLHAAERFWDGKQWVKDGNLDEGRHVVRHRVIHECDDCSFEDESF